MRCNDFDAHIDEMLSGILHPDANHHMRHCERCTSHFRSRATVQNGLRQLASATLPGPSRATDRAVMDGFRRLQQRRAPAAVALALQNSSQNAAQSPRLLTFPYPQPCSGQGGASLVDQRRRRCRGLCRARLGGSSLERRRHGECPDRGYGSRCVRACCL